MTIFADKLSDMLHRQSIKSLEMNEDETELRIVTFQGCALDIEVSGDKLTMTFLWEREVAA